MTAAARHKAASGPLSAAERQRRKRARDAVLKAAGEIVIPIQVPHEALVDFLQREKVIGDWDIEDEAALRRGLEELIKRRSSDGAA